MTVSLDEARKGLDDLLKKAEQEGEVRIRRDDGGEFVVRPAAQSGLDVPGVKLERPITAEEIVAIIRQGRERSYNADGQ